MIPMHFPAVVAFGDGPVVVYDDSWQFGFAGMCIWWCGPTWASAWWYYPCFLNSSSLFFHWIHSRLSRSQLRGENSVTIVALPSLHITKSTDHFHSPLPFRHSPHRALTWMPASHPGIFADTIHLHHWFVIMMFQVTPDFVTMPGRLLTMVCSGMCNTYYYLFYPWMFRLRHSSTSVSSTDWLVSLNLLFPTDVWTNVISLKTVTTVCHRHCLLDFRIGILIFRCVSGWMHRGRRISRRLRRTHTLVFRIGRLLLRHATQGSQGLVINWTVHTKHNPVLSLRALFMLSCLFGVCIDASSEGATIDFTTSFKTQSRTIAASKISENVRHVLRTFEGCQLVGSCFPAACLGTIKDADKQQNNNTSRTELRQAAARQGLQALNTVQDT